MRRPAAVATAGSRDAWNVNEATCAWGDFRGDRVAPSAYRGKVYLWNHRGAFKNFPKASLGVGLPIREAKRLIPLLLRTIAEAEKQAKEAGIEIATARYPFSANARALMLGGGQGFVKTIADKNGAVVGVHVVGGGSHNDYLNQATADAARTYFGERASRITPGRLATSLGTAGLLAGTIGGMPVCHGAGGLTAHYRFGARRAAAPALMGVVLLVLALALGGGLAAVLAAFPLPILAGLLATAGLLGETCQAHSASRMLRGMATVGGEAVHAAHDSDVVAALLALLLVQIGEVVQELVDHVVDKVGIGILAVGLQLDEAQLLLPRLDHLGAEVRRDPVPGIEVEPVHGDAARDGLVVGGQFSFMLAQAAGNVLVSGEKLAQPH